MVAPCPTGMQGKQLPVGLFQDNVIEGNGDMDFRVLARDG